MPFSFTSRIFALTIQKSYILFMLLYKWESLSFYGTFFTTCVASGRSTVNLERPLDHDGDPLAITAADAVAASGVPPWNWRETPGNGILST